MGKRATVLALDLGTSSVKGLLLDQGGVVVAGALVPYPHQKPRPGWIEQRPEDWWEAAKDAVRICLGQAWTSGMSPDGVRAIGLSGHMSGLVLIDRAGRPVRPCITISDLRATRQVARVRERVGEVIARVTKNPVIDAFLLPKLVWVMENEPRVLDRSAAFLLPKDYLRLMLTGRIASEPTDAGNTLLLDPLRRTWSRELVHRSGIDASLLPELIESTEVAGQLTDRAAEATGLPPGIPVVAGGADMACSALGTGCVRPGVVAVTLGTAGQVVTALEDLPELLFGKVTLHPHAIPGLSYVMGSHFTGGLAMSWFRQAVASPGDPIPFDQLEAEARAVPPGADGLRFLPFLVGSGSPRFDARVRGAFTGLGLSHRRGHLARAVMEGVACNLRQTVEALIQAGLPVEMVHLGGGGFRSRLWREIVAAVLGHAVHRLRIDDASALGAALLAGVGIGWWESLEAAVDAVVRRTSVEVPSLDVVDVYRAVFRSYQRVEELARAFAEDDGARG